MANFWLARHSGLSVARFFSAESAGSVTLAQETETRESVHLGDPTENNDDLRRICTVLGVAYQQINHEIDVQEQVRLLDEQQKRFLGVYSLDQAIAKAKSMGKEVVLMNKKVSPPLCKITDYRKKLYEQFIKDVIMAPTEEEKAKRKVRAKVITLRPKMTINDLKNKVRQAQEMADKYESVRVQISFVAADEDKARNLFDNFCSEARKVMDEASEAGETPVDKKKKADEDYDASDDEDADPSQTQMLRAEFKKRGSTGVFNFGNNVSLTLEKMRQLIDEYFNKKEKEVQKPFVSKMAAKLGATGASALEEKSEPAGKTQFRSMKEFKQEIRRQSRIEEDLGSKSKSRFKRMLKQRDQSLVKYEPDLDVSRTVEAEITQSTAEDIKNMMLIQSLIDKRHQKRAATYDLLRKLGAI